MTRKYKDGDSVGPANVRLVKRLDNTGRSASHPLALFTCPLCQRDFSADLYSVANGTTVRCKECRKEAMSGVRSPNFKDLKGKRFGKLVAVEYVGALAVSKKRNLSQSLWRCRCDCGKEKIVTCNNLTQFRVSSCDSCNLRSKGEYAIQRLLRNLNIEYENQKRFSECRDKKSLPFDFYLPKYNLCIEYDGVSHFYPNAYGSWNTPENVQKTKEHDAIKTAFCKNNNISLLRLTDEDYPLLSEQYLLTAISNSLSKT